MTSNAGIFHFKNTNISRDLRKGAEGEVNLKEISGVKVRPVLFRISSAFAAPIPQLVVPSVKQYKLVILFLPS